MDIYSGEKNKTALTKSLLSTLAWGSHLGTAAAPAAETDLCTYYTLATRLRNSNSVSKSFDGGVAGGSCYYATTPALYSSWGYACDMQIPIKFHFLYSITLFVERNFLLLISMACSWHCHFLSNTAVRLARRRHSETDIAFCTSAKRDYTQTEHWVWVGV